MGNLKLGEFRVNSFQVLQLVTVEQGSRQIGLLKPRPFLAQINHLTLIWLSMIKQLPPCRVPCDELSAILRAGLQASCSVSYYRASVITGLWDSETAHLIK